MLISHITIRKLHNLHTGDKTYAPVLNGHVIGQGFKRRADADKFIEDLKEQLVRREAEAQAVQPEVIDAVETDLSEVRP